LFEARRKSTPSPSPVLSLSRSRQSPTSIGFCWFESGQARSRISANVEALLARKPVTSGPLPANNLSDHRDRHINWRWNRLSRSRVCLPRKDPRTFSRARTLCLRLGNIPEYFSSCFVVGHLVMGGKRMMMPSSFADEFCQRVISERCRKKPVHS